ncbi:MAG: 2-oxo acid dehydrogenase subunit E2 [Burkholderiales bacterium]
MKDYETLPRNPYFEVLGSLNRENRSDCKVGMLTEVDLTQCARLRERLGKETGTKPSYTAFVAAAIVRALQAMPEANRIVVTRWPFGRRIVQLNRIDISVLVERDRPGSEQATYAATMEHVDSLDLVSITKTLQGFAQSTEETSPRWKTFRTIVEKVPAFIARRLLTVPNLSPELWIKHRGGAVAISSPAKYGVDMMVATWPWPIGFSFGFVKPRPWVVDGKLEVRTTMVVTMSFDRRLLAGAPGARFFNLVCQNLESAETTLSGSLVPAAPS